MTDAPPRIPWWNTDLGELEVEAAAAAIRGRTIHHGPLCRTFEDELAAALGLPHVVAATSGSVALLLALLACDVGPGDEVVVPALTFIAPAHAALLLGARVRLVDVCADRPVLDPDALRAEVGPRTKAIVVVHPNGRAADVAAVRAIAAGVGARVVEDCAQALFSRGPHGWLGGTGDIAAFSLGITKLLTTGEGGFVATRDAALGDRLRRLRNHGVHAIANNVFEMIGGNFRLTDLQAALGRAQLTRRAAKMEAVRRVYATYRDGLQGVEGVRLLEVDVERGELPLWSEVMCDHRAAVVAALAEQGIASKPFHPCLAASPHVGDARRFPHAERFAVHGLTLPSGPDQTPAALVETIAALRRAAGQVARGGHA